MFQSLQGDKDGGEAGDGDTAVVILIGVIVAVILVLSCVTTTMVLVIKQRRRFESRSALSLIVIITMILFFTFASYAGRTTARVSAPATPVIWGQMWTVSHDNYIFVTHCNLLARSPQYSPCFLIGSD